MNVSPFQDDKTIVKPHGHCANMIELAFEAVQLEAGFAIDTRRGNDWFLGYLSGLVAAGDFSRK